MARSTRTWIVAGLTAAAVIVAIVVHQLGDSGERQPLAQPAPGVHQERSVVTDEVADGAPDELTASAQSSPPCAGQQLEVTLNDSTESVCMGTLVTRYNGSVRSHEVPAFTTPRRWLRVEAAGNDILSVGWGTDERPEFYCQAADCKGITIGRRDVRGARVMTFERTSLALAGSKAAPSRPGALQLTGKIEIPPEQLPAFACAGQGVSIVTSDSSSQTFCPAGGAGFEIADDGTKRYRFTSLDGESLVVATDRDQRVRQVQFEGEVSLACRYSECGSVRISAADAQGARRFSFAGTTLIDTESGQSNAVLNGSLILPPL